MNSSSNSGRTTGSTAWATFILGAWLIISPFVLHISQYPAGLVNNIACGIALILLTVAGARFHLLRAAIVLLGAWLWASAFILGVPGRPYLWNNFLLALLTVVAVVAGESPYPDNYRPNRN